MKTLKWFGTVSYLIGMALTAFNVYPWNLVFGAVGGTAWFYIGIHQRDLALKTVEFASAAIYMSGIFYWGYNHFA
jgi:hypothetical protein